MLQNSHLIGFGVGSAGPVAHRYWRFSFTSWAGTGSQGEISEIELKDSGGTDQIPAMTAATTSGVTISANDEPTNKGWNAGDNSTSTDWTTADRTGTKTWKCDFGSGNSKSITSYTIRSRSNGFNYPVAWTLAYSDDDSSYTTVDTQSGQAFGSGEQKSYTIP